MKNKNEDKGRLGASFDSFLAEEGILEECEERAIKEVLAMQVERAMRAEGISKAQMARRMRTSRPALDRLLDAGNTSVTLHTLQRAAAAVGKRLQLELVEKEATGKNRSLGPSKRAVGNLRLSETRTG